MQSKIFITTGFGQFLVDKKSDVENVLDFWFGRKTPEDGRVSFTFSVPQIGGVPDVVSTTMHMKLEHIINIIEMEISNLTLPKTGLDLNPLKADISEFQARRNLS